MSLHTNVSIHSHDRTGSHKGMSTTFAIDSKESRGKELEQIDSEKEKDTKEEDQQSKNADDQTVEDILTAKEDIRSEGAAEFAMLLDPEDRPSTGGDSFSLETKSFTEQEITSKKSEETKELSVSRKDEDSMRESEGGMKELFKEPSGFTAASTSHRSGSVASRPSLVADVMRILSHASTGSRSHGVFGVEDENIDRQMYYDMYNTYSAKNRAEKQKNEYLHRLMGTYYRKRKMFHVLSKDIPDDETAKHYYRQLEELDRMNDTLTREQLKINNESQSLKSKYFQKRQEVDGMFVKLQNGELELAKEFADADPIRDSQRKAAIERCMKRQRTHHGNLRKIRLSFIKCRNMLQEKQDALDALDNLGPNHRLIDYEQLRMDNRNLKDKLEEKVSELNKIRAKCQNAMQVLAHQREKIALINTDIENIDESFSEVKEDYLDCREQLNALKQDKDYYRSEINKFKEQTSLITKPLLLRDMENTMDEVKILTEKVEEYHGEYTELDRQIKRIRKIIKNISHINGTDARISKIKDMFSIKPRESTTSDFGELCC